MVRKSTKEEFIKKAREKHGDKYNYDNVVYENNKTKVEIECNTCKSIFFQAPCAHLIGSGCKACSIINSKKQKNNTTLTTRYNNFIKKSKEKYGNRYNYDKVIYVNNKTPIDILCINCRNYFTTTPDSQMSSKTGYKQTHKQNI